MDDEATTVWLAALTIALLGTLTPDEAQRLMVGMSVALERLDAAGFGAAAARRRATTWWRQVAPELVRIAS